MPSDRRAVVVGALVAASGANIALLDTWQGLFVSANLSWLGKQQSMEAFLTAVLVVLLAAAIGAMSAGVRERVPLRVRQAIGDVGLLAAIFSISAVLWRVNGGMLTTVDTDLRSFGATGRVAAGLAGLLAMGVLARHWRRCMRAVRGLLLLLAPFLVVTLGRASVAMSRADFTEADRNVPSRGIAAPRAGPRVIIVVFDELDYTHAFQGRPADVHLPAFDQLRGQSVFATNVTPPADATDNSLPSYIAGESVTPAVVRRQYSREFRDRGKPGAARDQSTIFHDAAQLGAPSELVGFYLPYCGWSFATLLERCTSLPFTWGGVFDGRVGIGASLVRQLLALAVVGNRMAQIARIEEATAASIRAISDSSRRLIFLHLPVPHFPPVWDARHGRYTVSQFSVGAYFDNLALADSVLARLLSAIDQSATAPPTFLIVTSDHPWRSGPIGGRVGGRIPFIVRAPSAEQIDVSSRVDAVRLRALTAQLLGGKLTTGRDVAEWLTSPAVDEVVSR